jgi:hypothetical protein
MAEPGDYRDQYGQSSSRYSPPPPGNPPQGYPVHGYPQGAPQPGYPEQGYQAQRYPGPDPESRGQGRLAGPGFRGRSLLWVALVLVNVILALDFIFFLAGANDVGFGHIVYGVGNALNVPFRGLFNISLTPGAHPVQWADVIAIVVYTMAALIIDRLIVIVATPSRRASSSRQYQGSPPPRY